MQVHILERILFVAIVCTVVFAGRYLYTYLVSIYQSHWPHVLLASHLGDGAAWPTTSCISHVRWTPIESLQLDRGQCAAFQSHTSFMLPAGAAGDPETSRFLLSLHDKDRHASSIVYFDQSTSAGGAAAAAAVIDVEIKVEAFYESEEALRAETRTICALRPSRGQYGIGIVAYDMPTRTCRFPWRVLQAAAVPGHEYSARDDITLNITVGLPGPRAAEAHVPQSQCVIGESPPHANAFGGQLSMPLMGAPIEVDTAQINTPHRHVRDKCNDVSSSLEPAAAAAAEPNIAAGIPTYINGNDLPLSILLTTTDAQIIRRIYPADSKSDGFIPVSIRMFGQAPDETLDLGVSSTSGCNLGTVPLPCIRAPFELMATTIHPSVNAELGMEEPTEKSRNRCMKSRIVRHGACLIPDIECVTKRSEYSFRSCWRNYFHATGGVCLSLVSYIIHSREADISRKRTLSFETRKLSYLRPRLLYKVIQRGSEPS